MKALVLQDTPESEARIDNLKELVSSAEEFHVVNAGLVDAERTELDLYLDQVALIADVDGYEQRAERVSLMTAHSAKGLEFPVVFMVGMEEGIFHHQSSTYDDAGLEEERRLCYVAMTRAMEQLVMTCARERRRFGAHSYQTPSRFLREVPEKLMNVEGGAVEVRRPARRRGGEGAGEPRLDYSYSQESYEEGEGGVAVGTVVRHPIFGRGIVMTVIGQGLSQKLKIRFERAGVKTVMVRYANLELA